MKTIKYIRTKAKMSEQEFAEYFGVQKDTVKNWEESAYSNPSIKKQKEILEFCDKRFINPIKNINSTLSFASYLFGKAHESDKNNSLVLFSSSDKGINAPIRVDELPKSLDFGRGFYAYCDYNEALANICGNNHGIVSLIVCDCANLKIYNFKDTKEWLLYTAYSKGYLEKYKNDEIYEKLSHLTDGYDIIIGPTVDDKLFSIIDDFFKGIVTDKAVHKVLHMFPPAQQVAFKTQKACNEIKVMNFWRFNYIDNQCLSKEFDENRAEALDEIAYIRQTTRRDGKYFDELINSDWII